MKAWNRKHKPKHWTKAKWYCRKFFGGRVFLQITMKMKQKFKSDSLFFNILQVSNKEWRNGLEV